MRPSTKVFLLAVLLGCGLAAMSQSRLNRAYQDRCHWDGTPIQPIFRVEWLPGKEDSEARHFYCICCAQSWMAAQQIRQGRFSVRDEIGGFPMDALSGYYVESESVTETVTGCRIHVFREPLHARAHLLQHQGKPVPCPLQLLQKSNAQGMNFGKKKAKRGIETPKQEIYLVKRRPKAGEQHYRDTHGKVDQ